MAQTKRKRRSKHRGTPVGTIETRGRTGRRPAAEGKGGAKPSSRQARANRLDQPPTWRGAATRAGIAAVILVFALILLFKLEIPRALGLGLFAIVVYVPLGFYTDLAIYRFRQRRKLREQLAARESKGKPPKAKDGS